MPTKRIRLSRKRVEIAPELLALLRDEPMPSGGNVFTFKFTSEDELRSLWAEHGSSIISEWVETAPGTRPPAWWTFSAPRQPIGRYPGWYYDGQLPEPRLRVGGKGTPCHEVLAHVPNFLHGIPGYWVDDMWIVERGVKAERFDPDDPPVFESQTSYLKRHGLLFEREGARLTAADFEPEALPVELWPALS